MNVFLSVTKKIWSDYDLTIDFPKGNDVHGSMGLFWELGLAEMLEVWACDSND